VAVGAFAVLAAGAGCGSASPDGGKAGGGGWGSAPDPGSGDDGGPQGGEPSTRDSGRAAGGDSGSGAGDAGGSSPKDAFDQFQHHNLDVLNRYRAGMAIAPLVLDARLCAFALAGSQELSQDHSPHQHIIDAANSGALTSAGFGTSPAENQGDPNGWMQLSSSPVNNEIAQIDAILATMYAEGPGDPSSEAHGHYMNIMDSQFTRVGVGLLEIGGMLYLTNDFSN